MRHRTQTTSARYSFRRILKFGFPIRSGDLPEQIGLPSWSVAIAHDLGIKASHNHIVHIDLALPIEGAAGSS
jgi:hypothetical protein